MFGKQAETGKSNAIGKTASNATSSSSAQYLIPLNYDIVVDMKKTKVNISLYELSQLTSQKNLLFKAFEGVCNNVIATNKATNGSATTQTNQSTSTKVPNLFTINSDLIGKKYRSKTPPFPLTFEVYNNKMHNCLVDSRASTNVMSYVVCQKLNA